MEIKVHKKENFYFALKIIVTILILLGLVSFFSTLVNSQTPLSYEIASFVGIFVFYVLIICSIINLQKIFLIGHLKGNGVQITEKQFPEIYTLYQNMVTELQIKKQPPLFVIQAGGVLNAFAIRFSGKNYIALYSDIFDLIEKDTDLVKFILAHELGHVKRNHMSKRFWTMLSSIVPFLMAAYSRVCEFTCDNIGQSVSENGAKNGLLALAIGTKLYPRVNIENLLENAEKNNSFAVKITRMYSSHPFIPARLKNLNLR